MELVEFAFHYDQIMYCFELADRGQFEVRYDSLEQRTIFIYASGDESAADTLLRSHERDSNIEWAAEADKAVVVQLAQEARQELERTILFVDPDAISYRITPTLLAVAKRWAEVLAKARRWEFPQDLSIGNLTFDDVRKFSTFCRSARRRGFAAAKSEGVIPPDHRLMRRGLAGTCLCRQVTKVEISQEVGLLSM